MGKERAEFRMYESSEQLSSALADYVHQISETSLSQRHSFSIVLPGGGLPNRLRKLTTAPYLKMVEWSKWHVFWAEENVVPNKRHPDSLYRQAKDSFISKVPIHPEHVISVSHGISGESAANVYEFSIRQQVRNRTVAVSQTSDCPTFDLILLNLGAHGNVSSLYPRHPVLDESSQWVAYVDKPKESITITLPVINAAAHVAIVASGAELAHSFSGAVMGFQPNNPAHRISLEHEKLVWFVDSDAASLLLHNQGNDASSSFSAQKICEY